MKIIHKTNIWMKASHINKFPETSWLRNLPPPSQKQRASPPLLTLEVLGHFQTSLQSNLKSLEILKQFYKLDQICSYLDNKKFIE
jgi:hypothetical protein